MPVPTVPLPGQLTPGDVHVELWLRKYFVVGKWAMGVTSVEPRTARASQAGLRAR